MQLSLVPQHIEARDRLGEARELMGLVASWQAALWAVALLLASIMGLVLAATGQPWGGLLIGAAVSLALSRYGPAWWPGRR